MKEPASRPADPAPRRAQQGAGAKPDSFVKRADMELPDGRYLLVFSRKPHA